MVRNNICSVDVQTFKTFIFSEENLIIRFLWFWIIVRHGFVLIPVSSGQPARIVPYKLRAKIEQFPCNLVNQRQIKASGI